MIKSVNLITADHKHHKQHDKQDKLLSDHLKFRYDFVRRYFASQAAITQWEDSAGIEEEYRLGSVINTNWNRYCKQVVDTLQVKLDLVKMTINLPSAISDLQTGAVVLQSVASDIRDAISCIAQIANQEELNGISDKMAVFGDYANSNFNDLLRQNIEELFTFTKDSIQKSNMVRKFQSLYFMLFIVHLPEVKERAGHQFLDQLGDYMNEYLSDLDDTEVLNNVELALGVLKVDYREETCKLFAVVLFEKLAVKAERDGEVTRRDNYQAMSKFLQTGVMDVDAKGVQEFYRRIRVQCSVIVPFTIFLRPGRSQRNSEVAAAADYKAKILSNKIEFDGFTLNEFLSQSIPN